MIRPLCIALVLLAALAQASCAQTWPGADDAHDFIFFGEARPLLIRVRVQVDGKSLAAAWDEFIDRLFRQHDPKGKGYLEREEIDRFPPMKHIATGDLGSVNGARSTPASQLKEFDADGDGKVTRAEFAAHCRKRGLAPFQLQPEASSNAGGLMMMMGGASAEPTVAEISQAIFARLDVKKTGKLTKAELAAAPERLLKLDTDDDEVVTIRELTPAQPGKTGGMMGSRTMPALGGFSKPLVNADDQRVILLAGPGKAPPDLVRRLHRRYTPKDAKLGTNRDGMLEPHELARFVNRAPDMEVMIYLGDTSQRVELLSPKAKAAGLAEHIRATSDFAFLDLRTTRVELRGEPGYGSNPYAGIARVQWTFVFKQADANKDGFLDENEASSNPDFSAAFKAMDGDRDGKVSEQEFTAYLDAIADLHRRSLKACVHLVLSDESRGLFDLLDIDRDGRLSVRELRGAVKLLPACLPKAEHGGREFLTPYDMPKSYRLSVRRGPIAAGDDYGALIASIYGGGSAAQTYSTLTAGPLWFRKMDRNRDGDVSRREWLGAAVQFRLIDTDGDGLISPDEADRFDALHRGRTSPISTDDAGVAKLLRGKGASVTESKGAITAITFQDASQLTDADFRLITQQKHLKMLTLSKGLDDARIAQLAALAELEYLQTNLAQITDDGVKPLAQLKNLKNLKFFHPGKAFTGAGLAHLKDMPNLERLTVAGSLEFNDAGLAAVAQLTRLKEFRTWHAGGTDAGVKKLTALKNLKSLYLGQRLTYKLPACPSDETIAILAQMKSLESLQLDEARLSFTALQQLKQLPALKKLTLGGIDIPKEDVERLQRELPRTKFEWTAPNEVYQKRIRALFSSR